MVRTIPERTVFALSATTSKVTSLELGRGTPIHEGWGFRNRRWGMDDEGDDYEDHCDHEDYVRDFRSKR